MSLSRSRSDIPPIHSVQPQATNPTLNNAQYTGRQYKLSQPGAEAPAINRPLHWGFKSMRPLAPSKPIQLVNENKPFTKKYGTGSRKRKTPRPSNETHNVETEKVRFCKFPDKFIYNDAPKISYGFVFLD